MSFIDFARAHGVDIDPSKLYPSDRIRRTGTVDKPKSTNGAYFYDGQRGWVFNWSEGAQTIWYEEKGVKPWTPEERRKWSEKKAQDSAERDKKQNQVATDAAYVIKAAKLEAHDYLHLKGFPDLKMPVMNKILLVPMRNVVTNKVQGYQQIYWDMLTRKWEKKMLTGMRAKNAVLYMGNREASEAWLVEGLATGLSVHAALRSVGLDASVVVCFSASNLVQVADQIPGRRFVFADNDESHTGEKAAAQTGLSYAMADTVGWDANDLHKAHGLFAVVKCIMAARAGVLMYS
tara:strand:- start:3127 stop:3996 length:870 start_codon:yes stop_codon:yes gene_type:complete